MRKFIKPLVALGAVAMTAAAQPGASPEGRWLTQRKHGIVEIYECGGDGTLCGRLAWFQVEPGDPNTQGIDRYNPDPARRSRSLCGLVFMTGLKPAGANSWEEGMLYDPESGHTYRGTITLQADGTLRLRGYIGVPLLGESNVWTRHTGPVPTCPSR
jgi:uncharacterized protein (DUF2147 family)